MSNMKSQTKIDENVVFAMNESARDVYMALRMKKLKVSQIEKKTKLAPRTVRQAIKKLRDLKLVKQVPDLSDFRSHYYAMAN